MAAGTEATALVFPGQGSQRVGMGRDLAAAYQPVRHLYEQADDILGFSLSRLCFEGPDEALNDTINTQPALFVTCLAILRALQIEGVLPHAVPLLGGEPGLEEGSTIAAAAGHSLGELTALVAAGALGTAEGLRLVRERGRLMKLAGERSPGGMAAVIRMEDTDVEEACREATAETRQPVQVANYNAPGQVVISGSTEALSLAIERLRARGARRIVPLAVSIAAHSPLMAGVVAEYRKAVDATPLQSPAFPVVGNVSARPLRTPGEIRDELAGQLTWPVRWTASVQWMAAQGVDRFLEVGPGDVLTKLIQRIVPDVPTVSIGTVAAVRGMTEG